jgi:hypothetical protein
MRFPCSLCDSLDHFTYQCSLIIEYMRSLNTCIVKWPLFKILQPPHPLVIQVIPPIPSPDIVHITSPDLESLPAPPWFHLHSTPRDPFPHITSRYACSCSKLSNNDYMFFISIYCSCRVFSFNVRRYLIITNQCIHFRYMIATHM